jgi:hypothetical protein
MKPPCEKLIDCRRITIVKLHPRLHESVVPANLMRLVGDTGLGRVLADQVTNFLFNEIGIFAIRCIETEV